MSKLIIKKKKMYTSKSDANRRMLQVDPAVHDKLKELSWESRYSMKELASTLLDYAIENTIIEEEENV